MKKRIEYLLFTLLYVFVACSPIEDKIYIQENDNAFKLKVNNQDFFIIGMNWDYFPIGTNYEYSLWNQSDDFIEKVLHNEMTLLKEMGVNSIRQYVGVPSKWISYIYNNYGIYTMLNHSFGRYGLTIDGEVIEVTQYSNPKVQELLITEVKKLARNYKDTSGLIMYLLGNENNYGLFWEGAETENIPDKVNSTSEAIALYKLFNKAALAIKEIDRKHPVALCNGDDQFIDIIAQECKDVDIFGVNSYRGISFTDLFKTVKEKLNKPLMFTEFGADAFDALKSAENQQVQAHYLKGNWKEIYENAAGFGKSENSIGGFTFQFSDGWWKYGQTKNLSIHDTNASWSNQGYLSDFSEGFNNMNEEWFGICAKISTGQDGFYDLEPREAYYTLKKIHKFNPYDTTIEIEQLVEYLSKISINEVLKNNNNIND